MPCPRSSRCCTWPGPWPRAAWPTASLWLADQLTRARLATGAPVGDGLLDDSRGVLAADGVESVADLLSLRLFSLVSLGLVAAWNPPGAVALLIAWLVYHRAVARWFESTYALDATEDRTTAERAEYLRELLTGGRAAAEVRIFQAAAHAANTPAPELNASAFIG